MLTVSDAYFPVVLMHFEQVITLEDCARMARWLDEMIERGKRENQKLISVTDTKGTQKVTAPVRRAFAEYSRNRGEEKLAMIPVSAAVVESAFVRGAMTAISWISPSVSQTQVAADMNAVAKLIPPLCEKERIEVPANFYRMLLERYGVDVGPA